MAKPDRALAKQERALTAQAAAGEVQVKPEHYDFERYDDLARWCSYWYQIRSAMRLRPRSVLEIGSGTGVFRSYLRNAGIQVASLDIDDSRTPDYVGSVAELDRALPPGLRFDAIAAFQVLEHLPFEQFETCLEGLASRADHVLLSLPHHGSQWRLSFRFPGLRGSRGFHLPHPWKFRRAEFPEHHWELGVGYSIRGITKIIRSRFDVIDRRFVPENPYHYMWVLKTKPR